MNNKYELELYFNDLNDRGQKKYLKFTGIDNPIDRNLGLDIKPVAIVKKNTSKNNLTKKRFLTEIDVYPPEWRYTQRHDSLIHLRRRFSGNGAE